MVHRTILKEQARLNRLALAKEHVESVPGLVDKYVMRGSTGFSIPRTDVNQAFWDEFGNSLKIWAQPYDLEIYVESQRIYIKWG